MIEYDFGKWGIMFAFKGGGSVFQKSLPFALISGLFAYLFHKFVLKFIEEEIIKGPLPDLKGLGTIWGSFTFILGFLLVFRTQIAYGRYWEGCQLLHKIRSVWFNAASNVFAFCSRDPSKHKEVDLFQQTLVRLFSMMHCMSLQEIAVMDDENFEYLGDVGFDKKSLLFLYQSADKLEIVMQWIQRLIVKNLYTGVIDIQPPILSRVFQELSNGIVDVHSACVITDYPFPFPYAQMVSFMLLTFSVMNPIVCCVVVDSPLLAAALTYTTVLGVWSLNYISAEIEMPFGDDPNDLPVHEHQTRFNRKLTTLLNPLAQHPPSFNYSKAKRSTVKVTVFGPETEMSAMGSMLSAQDSQILENDEGAIAMGSMASTSSMTSQKSLTEKEAEKHEPPVKRKLRHWTTQNALDWKEKVRLNSAESVGHYASNMSDGEHVIQTAEGETPDDGEGETLRKTTSTLSATSILASGDKARNPHLHVNFSDVELQLDKPPPSDGPPADKPPLSQPVSVTSSGMQRMDISVNMNV